ncbi:MAG: hypothetical protein QF586_06325 [Arenicellales bacterium]|nr:hypothetical protein [Arenicellales bacterium]
MASEEKDWNAIFAERKAEHDATRAKELAEAKTAAEGTDKEPFNREQFQTLYSSLNPDDVSQHTVWESLLNEAEYDYYVSSIQRPDLFGKSKAACKRSLGTPA